MKKCECCGKELSAHNTDIGFQLPDIVWQLTDDQKKKRSTFNSDLCSLDDSRYFIRGAALIPFQSRDDSYAWGLWAEVTKEDFDHYLSIYDKDGSNEPKLNGHIANTPAGYEGIQGHPVQIILGPPSQRPLFHLLPSKHKNVSGTERWHF